MDSEDAGLGGERQAGCRWRVIQVAVAGARSLGLVVAPGFVHRSRTTIGTTSCAGSIPNSLVAGHHVEQGRQHRA